MKSNLCLGMTYFEFQTSVTFKGRSSATTKTSAPQIVRPTAHVTRIDPSLAPFVVGSVTNGKDPSDLRQGVKAKREALKLKDKLRKITEEKFFDPSRKLPGVLEPVWISNGTFFDLHGPRFVRVLGPIIHRNQAVLDVPSYIGPEKSQRWYIHQTTEEPYKQVYYAKKTSGESLMDLASVEQELLGGAGLIISEYEINFYFAEDKSYRSKYPFGDGYHFGNGFEFGATYSSGTVIAKCIQKNRPIYYVIYLRGPGGIGLSWFEVANYLLSGFKEDMKKERGVLDSQIKEACVFDGGSSQQLWVRNQPTQMRFSGVKVPNYICIWGVKP